MNCNFLLPRLGMILLLLPAGAQGRQYPRWRGSNLRINGVWEQSPLVAVGEVTNIASYGEQIVNGLPWPAMTHIRKLYWCTGDFQLSAVVKGEFRGPSRKYLWADTRPGCKLWDDDPSLVNHRFRTRVWFLREEGAFLRPTYDGGTYHFMGLLAKWDDNPRLDPRQQLGTLLLRPDANVDTMEQYAAYLWDVGDIACDLLGTYNCSKEIRALAERSVPVLRDAACNFLEGELHQKCR